MWVTLYCDASFDHREVVGGWAVWLRCEHGRVVRAGVCPTYVQHVYEAELAAIFAGVHLARAKWPDTTAVLIRSDCREALRIIDGKQQPRHHGAHRLRTHFQALRRSGLGLRTRWVKGHRQGGGVDAWLNRRVDQMARDVMRRERELRRRLNVQQGDEQCPVL